MERAADAGCLEILSRRGITWAKIRERSWNLTPAALLPAFFRPELCKKRGICRDKAAHRAAAKRGMCLLRCSGNPSPIVFLNGVSHPKVVNETKTSYLVSLSSQVTCRRAIKRHIMGTLCLSSKDLAPVRAFPPFMRFKRAVFQGQESRCGISNFKI